MEKARETMRKVSICFLIFMLGVPISGYAEGGKKMGGISGKKIAMGSAEEFAGAIASALSE